MPEAKKRLPGWKRTELRIRAQDLEPVVWVGKKGQSGALEEIDRQLNEKGLIKVRLLKSALKVEGKNRKDLAKEIAERLDAELIDVRGYTIVLFRPREGWKRYLSRLRKSRKQEGE